MKNPTKTGRYTVLTKSGRTIQAFYGNTGWWSNICAEYHGDLDDFDPVVKWW